MKCGLCEHHLKCQNNDQHDCGHPRKEEEEEEASALSESAGDITHAVASGVLPVRVTS